MIKSPIIYLYVDSKSSRSVNSIYLVMTMQIFTVHLTSKLWLYVLFEHLFVFHVEVSNCLPFFFFIYFFAIFAFIISSIFSNSDISLMLVCTFSHLGFFFFFSLPGDFLSWTLFCLFYSHCFLDLLQSLSGYILK